ncbi:hypothetical protein L486_01431 [Kwoniella mangroviensis CBS 10435]|uniref:Uncharacterized protein n=1 Tax=Kwoniella mangroviensis CBS 10435 TaxID=1331196 RepID=A0A1B9J1V9_9TREE|nr:hypothetical protein L486_01431 [Kwoniella mangroviensis CBS 10435]
MLRRIRAKLHPPVLGQPSLLSIRLSSSAALARVRETEEDYQHEPYGIEYGAGPSRIPYQPRSYVIPRSNHPTHPHSSQQLSRILRDSLNKLSPGAYAQPQTFFNALSNQADPQDGLIYRRYPEDLATLSRLELHAILHHLIRKKKGNLAAAIICDVLASVHREQRRRMLSIKTLSMLFKGRSIFNMSNAGSFKRISTLPEITPSIEDQIAPPPSRQLATLLNIMDSLQEVRYQRPIELYQLVIKQCVDEHLYDLAAKVYVGLVEEWVTEGRVAHGADPDDFHPGGGPPRSIEYRTQRQNLSKLLGHWWTGVRTWRLPGEVLSPHDRLDLWHPKHLSLGEKMKNFPLPIATSPPSLVPQPKSVLLTTIIVSLKLNPHTCSPQEFASSMRALAILANTVLSRTLPIVSLGKLLQVFKSAPSKPDVYPENITEIPKENQWAYTSFTQIHVTLMSLLFSPPISSHSMQLIAQNQDVHPEDESTILHSVTAEGEAMNRYMLPPLSWNSCAILLQYAFEGLRKPFALKKLLSYMKEMFGMGGANPQAFNTILKGSSALQLNAIAAQADMDIFGKQQYDRPSHAPPQREDTRFFSSSQRVGRDTSQGAKDAEEEFLNEWSSRTKTSFELGGSPLPNEHSLLLLIKHLTVTSQFNRLEDLVYILEPYLEFSKKMPLDELGDRIESKGLKPGESGRPRSQPLSYNIYLSLMRGLEKSGSTGLAQRVFNLVLYTEGGRLQEYLNENSIPTISDNRIPTSIKFPLDGYKIMLDVWGNETRFTNRLNKRNRKSNEQLKELPLGWNLPKEYLNLPRGVAAGYMTMVTHHLAKKNFCPEEFTKGYYESLIRACRWRWKLSEDKSPHHEFRAEIKDVILDIQDSGLEVPQLLRDKLTDERAGASFRWVSSANKMGKKQKTDEELLLGRLLNGQDSDAFVDGEIIMRGKDV